MNDKLPATAPPEQNPALPQPETTPAAKGPDIKPSYFRRHPIQFIFFILLIFATIVMIIEKFQVAFGQRQILQSVQASEFETQQSITGFRRRVHCRSTGTFAEMSKFECHNYKDFLYYVKDRTELLELLGHIDTKLEPLAGGDRYPSELKNEYAEFRGASQKIQALDAVLDKMDGGSTEYKFKFNDELQNKFGRDAAIYVCIFSNEILVNGTKIRQPYDIVEPPCPGEFMQLTHAILPYMKNTSGYVVQLTFMAFRQEHKSVMQVYELIY